MATGTVSPFSPRLMRWSRGWKRLARLEARLGELERLSTAKVAELTRPGPVLLRLAVPGFGVTLPDKKGDR